MVRGTVIALALAALGCRQILGIEGAQLADASADTSATDEAPPSDSALEDVPVTPLWGNVELLPGQSGDSDPSLTGDMLELYFHRLGGIYVMKRASVTAGWGAPEAVMELNNILASEIHPDVTANGLAIAFGSTRSGGDFDVFAAVRSSPAGAWTMLDEVSALTSPNDDIPGPFTDDGLAIVIASSRAAAELDLYESQRAELMSPFPDPSALATLNTAFEESGPHLSRDGLVLHFASRRDGSRDLYVTRRATRTSLWDTPVRIDELATVDDESDPWVSPDGQHMYFSSNRSGNGSRLYHATRN